MHGSLNTLTILAGINRLYIAGPITFILLSSLWRHEIPDVLIKIRRGGMGTKLATYLPETGHTLSDPSRTERMNSNIRHALHWEL
jgi:hypothetical protein